MSAQSMQQFARKMYFEEDFFLLVLRNPDKAIAAFGQGSFTPAEVVQIQTFAHQQTAYLSAQIDQLGGGGIVDLGNGGCGVWC